MPHSNFKSIRSPQNWRSNKKNSSKQKAAGWWAKNKKSWWRLFFLSLVALAVVGSLALIIMLAWVSKDLPEPGKLQERIVPESTKIYDRTGENILYEIHGDQKRTLVKLNDIPDHTKLAFIALEDKNFFQHKGLSVKHIFKAMFFYGLKKIGLYDGLVPGGSTLTQQFVKNSILTREKTVTRKVKEWLLAYQLEKKYNKEEILELYFNEIPFGSTSYGIEAASQTYFAKSATQLNLAESAILAAMIQAPTYYSPYGNHTDELYNRQRFVLNEMVKVGFISEDEAEKAKNVEINFKKSLENIQAPHFVLYVKELLTEKYGERQVEQGGLRVFTTLDTYKQQIAEEELTKQGDINAEKWGAENAALVSLDPKTGEILALVGSRDFFNEEIDGQVNVALRPRQPGSSFKPIVYTAAWEKGYVPETTVFDVVTRFKTEIGKDYVPRNYDSATRGPISLRKALQGSLNIPAVKILYLAGIENVLVLAEKMGYSTLQDRSRFGLSLVLGGGEIELLEHASAFGTLAREGIRQEPVAILKVEDNKGNVLEEFSPSPGKQVIPSEIARITNSVLSDDGARAFAFGTGSRLTLPGRPVAAKTGTTNDYRDAWTLGYTPSLVTGVWVGNNDFTEMKPGAAGLTVAAPIWQNYMKRVLGNTPAEYFNEVNYDIPDKPMVNGSVGQETKIKIDSVSGLLATEYTPAELIQEKTYRTIHNILYFVDKSNPLGPIPGENSNDPQYQNWEQAVLTWAKEEGVEAQELPPTEFDNIHTPDNQPFVAILQPYKNQTTNRSLFVRIEWQSNQPINKIELYVDDVFMQDLDTPSANSAQFNLSLDELFSPGKHFLKVVVFDQYKNSSLAWEEFILQ